MNKQQLTEKHSFVSDTIFRLKTLVLTIQRVFKNLLSSTSKFYDKGLLIEQPIIASSESDLWNPFDNKENWILTAGKIQNLRIAAKKIHGIEVKANETFSFWRHIGNPNFGKGYVIGREIREGCIVPTIAGGLCQLSNALYDAALKANFDIVERHKHTKVIKGSLAEQDRDATVKWNYIDLQFKSNFDFRIEVELSSDKLMVRLRSEQKNEKSSDTPVKPGQSDKLNDCYSCGNLACFKHSDRTSIKPEVATTTFILDEKWPEYDAYIKEIATDADNFILPLQANKFIKTDRYTWSSAKFHQIKFTNFQGIYRAIKLRFAPKNKNNVFELALQLDKKIAIAAARQIPIDSTHLVISQNLLPFLFETGALGGRTFDVLMTRLPFEKLHQRLDSALSNYPESPTLKDFRASKHLIEVEKTALNKARQIITPHTEIAELFKNKVVKLAWFIPSATKQQSLGQKVLFPASAVGRKGAYEIKRLAHELQLDLLVSGRKIEHDNFWNGLKTEQFNGNFDQIDLVVYPTFIEHQPRQILKAIAKGIPVITTTACGLDPSDQVEIVELNNFERLSNAVKSKKK
jgi:hypothetical protein